jgi:hypothetical protein
MTNTNEIAATLGIRATSSIIDNNPLDKRINEAITKWLEAEITKTIKDLKLDKLPVTEQMAILKEGGFQQRLYPDKTIHWGRFSPLLNEWFDISVFRVEVKVMP